MPLAAIDPAEMTEDGAITPVAEPSNIAEEQKISEQTIISSTHKTDISEAQQTDTDITKTDPLNDLLEKAQLALDEYQTTNSKPENASSLYQQVLTLDPDNATAKAGIESLFDIMLTRAQTEIDSKHFQDAKITLEKATNIKPEHTQIQTLNRKLVEVWGQDIVNEAQKDANNGNYASALSRLNAFLNDYPDNPMIISAQKSIQQQQKNNEYFSKLLKLIHERIEQDALVFPVNDNAKHYIFKARTIRRDNKELAKLANRLQTLLLIKARKLIAVKKYENAAKWLNEAKIFIPDDKQTQYVATELETAKKRAKEEMISSLLKEAEQHIKNNNLVLPKNDNAKYYLLEAQSKDPDNKTIQEGLRHLSERLVLEANKSLVNENIDNAKAYMQEIDKLELYPANYDVINNKVEYAHAQQEALSKPVPLSELEIINYESPKYPKIAKWRGIEGWVDIEFVTDMDGNVEDIKVINSHPKNKFVKVTLKAVKKWKFKPMHYNNRPLRQKAYVRLRFEK
ncbi:MAG: TonB family protein [Proteobacteria bacterium]|nr:TonB family protein [Pseudomonadota bacterium]